MVSYFISTAELITLIDGYLRQKVSVKKQHESALSHTIGSNLKDMVFVFSKELLDTSIIDMSNEHMIRVKGASTRGATAIIDFPMNAHDPTVYHRWSIVIHGATFPNFHYFIGIASNRFKDRGNFKLTPSTAFGDFTGLSGGYRTPIRIMDSAFSHCSEQMEHTEMNGQRRLLCFNGERHELRIIYPGLPERDIILNISPDHDAMKQITHWYPVVCLCVEGDSAEICVDEKASDSKSHESTSACSVS